MDEDGEVDLLDRFWALHTALLLRDGLEHKLRSGRADEAILDRSLEASETVLATRNALYRHLIEAGWTPPTTLVVDLRIDEALLAQPDGAVHG